MTNIERQLHNEISVLWSSLKGEQEYTLKLLNLLASTEGVLMNTYCESGVCMCGEEMANHSDPMTTGHSPCDSGGYYQDSLLKEISATLKPWYENGTLK